jgi:hypothetical protein
VKKSPKILPQPIFVNINTYSTVEKKVAPLYAIFKKLSKVNSQSNLVTLLPVDSARKKTYYLRASGTEDPSSNPACV